jgi:hypothetical protein
MDRILSYKKVDEFFNDLAIKHVDIKDYCGTSEDEFTGKLSDTTGFESPFLVFYDYFGKLEGGEQRTFNNRSLAFSILYSSIDVDDYQAQKNAISNAEEIGLEVLSRINVQSKMPDIGWLYKNFDKNSVTMDEVILKSAGGFFGMEFHFDLKVLEPLIVNQNKWIDGDIFCT